MRRHGLSGIFVCSVAVNCLNAPLRCFVNACASSEPLQLEGC